MRKIRRLYRRAVKPHQSTTYASAQASDILISIFFWISELALSLGVIEPAQTGRGTFLYNLKYNRQKIIEALLRIPGMRRSAMAGPKLLKSGRAAMEAVAKILPTAHSIVVASSMGPVELKPGAIWSGNKMLFYCTPLFVWYAVDDRVYEWGTNDFIRSEWLNALSEGAKRATPMVTLAKVEWALISGIFVPWYLMLGLACAKVGLLYASHKSVINPVMKHVPQIIGLLRDLKRRSPTLLKTLLRTAARELLADLPSGVTAEDVAFWLGRIIQGARAAPELTFGALIKIVSTVTALVTLTHLPSIAAHAAAGAAAAKAAELSKNLAAAGYTVTEAEAKMILREVMAQKDTVDKLRQLEVACKALLPSLEVLKEAYGAMR